MSTFIDKTNYADASTQSGNKYTGIHLTSATHILDIPAELAVLINAVHHNDVNVVRIEAVKKTATQASPLVLKILADHSARTGKPIHYTLRDEQGAVLFETKDARLEIGSYSPQNNPIKSILNRSFTPATIQAKDFSKDQLESILRKSAVLGVARNFPTYDNASGYGAAVRTTNGDIYFGGQYSSFDGRLGAHAEMAVLTRALSKGASGFTHLALASTKFKKTIASPCGCCLQFITEVARATNSTPNIHLFAMETDLVKKYTLAELLPVQWTNNT